MGRPTALAGRLIAVDASRGRDVTDAAEALAARLHAQGVSCGISRWDASGVFADLILAERETIVVSPRMLALLYATDLMFRLRWEIRPALAEGHVVIAAPYIATSVAVGVGLGLPEPWLRDLVRFAEPPDHWVRAAERRRSRGWKAKTARGYAEYCVTLLDSTPARIAKRKARARSVRWLEQAARSTEWGGLGRKELAAIVERYRQPSGGG